MKLRVEVWIEIEENEWILAREYEEELEPEEVKDIYGYIEDVSDELAEEAMYEYRDDIYYKVRVLAWLDGKLVRDEIVYNVDEDEPDVFEELEEEELEWLETGYMQPRRRRTYAGRRIVYVPSWKRVKRSRGRPPRKRY